MAFNSRFATASLVLASSVADDGTFTLSYPTGTTQASFTAGLAGSGHYIILNNNDKWSVGDPGISVSFDSSEITITNLTGGAFAAGTEVLVFLDRKATGPVAYLHLPILLAGVTAADVLTGFRPGVSGTIEDVQFIVTTAVTTAGDGATLNLEIGTTNVTGGNVVLTSANSTPLGAVIAGTAITGNNTLTPESLLSVEASSVTAFAEGAGLLVIRIRLNEPAA